jgi:Lon protease-like protein
VNPELHRARLPLIALNTVLFPGGRLPLRIFEQRYLDMVKQAIADNTPFGVCAIREGHETGAPAVPHDVGTLVRITDWDMPQTGILHIETQAGERFVLRGTETTPGGLVIGTVDSMRAEPATPVPDRFELAVEILRGIIDELGHARFPTPFAFDDAAWVGFRLSEILPLKLAVRQDLLEMNDSIARLHILTEFLKKRIN